MSDSLRPHGLHRARPPCPSPTPGACSNSCPLSLWCHPTISSSVIPSPLTFNLSQHQGLFQWVSSLHQVAKVLEFQLQHQSFQWIFRTDFLQDWLVWSPCSPRDSQESSPNHSSKASVLQHSTSFIVQLSHPYITTGETIALSRWPFVGKAMCLLFNMLSRLASLVAQLVKNPPAMWETWVRSLGQEDPLEKEMATHSSTLAWKIPWTERPGRLQSMGLQRVGHYWTTSLFSDLWKDILLVHVDLYFVPLKERIENYSLLSEGCWS